MKKIKVMIVDDHQVVRDGLKRYINNDENLELVNEAENGKQALQFLEETHADVTLCDLNMPEMDGLEFTEQVVNNKINTKVIILTMMDEPHYIKQLMGSGAEGYLFKNSGIDEVKSHIQCSCWRNLLEQRSN